MSAMLNALINQPKQAWCLMDIANRTMSMSSSTPFKELWMEHRTSNRVSHLHKSYLHHNQRMAHATGRLLHHHQKNLKVGKILLTLSADNIRLYDYILYSARHTRLSNFRKNGDHMSKGQDWFGYVYDNRHANQPFISLVLHHLLQIRKRLGFLLTAKPVAT